MVPFVTLPTISALAISSRFTYEGPVTSMSYGACRQCQQQLKLKLLLQVLRQAEDHPTQNPLEQLLLQSRLY